MNPNPISPARNPLRLLRRPQTSLHATHQIRPSKPTVTSTSAAADADADADVVAVDVAVARHLHALVTRCPPQLDMDVGVVASPWVYEWHQCEPPRAVAV